jgi:2'-5' RNA ligase superfamily
VPSDDPILVDEDMLRTVSGTAMVVLRPVAELADAFERWQGEILDRLGGERAAVPAAHATVKAFGAPEVPLTGADEATIADVVTGWARDTPPVELRAEAIEVFEPDAVPVLRLKASDGFLLAVRELRARAGEAGLPPAHSDEIGVDDWIPHLSLAYLRNRHAALRGEFGAWSRAVAIGDAACLVAEVELVAYTGGTERRVGSFPLQGNSGRS